MAETDDLQRQGYEVEKGLFHSEADLKYILARFGDHLAEREGYHSSELKGLEAVRYFLMQKHHWTPATVMSMSDEHLRFALLEEQAGWTLPAEARL